MSGLSNAEVALFNVWLDMMCTSADGQILLIDALEAAVELPHKVGLVLVVRGTEKAGLMLCT